MKQRCNLLGLLAILAATAVPQYSKELSPVSLAGVTCQIPPPLHCPDANCPGPLVIEQGTAVEPQTGRKFFVDFPCDLKRGEKVTFILSLHGAGSYGNWQRHYFPIMDYATKYRLVIATPNTPTRVWSPADDGVSAEHRQFDLRPDRREEHSGLLAGGPFAGRYDLQPPGTHRFL